MKTFAGTKLAAAVSLAALALVATPAQADVVTLDTGNSVVAAYPGPYATVTINLTDSTNASITFTSLANSGNVYDLGDGGSAGLNVNATTFTVGTVTGSNIGSGFATPTFTLDSGNVNGFGVFNLVIDSSDGYADSSTTISFSLHNVSGTWANAADVLTPNSHGAEAVAHIFVCAGDLTSGCVRSAGALATGFAAGSGGTTPPTEIPEPDSSSLALLALGLLGVGFWPRRKA